MITFLFCMLMLAVFGKLAVFAFRAAWGITKIIVVISDYPADFGIGLYRISDFDHCGDRRSGVIPCLGR